MKTFAVLIGLVVALGVRLDLYHGLGPRGTDGQYYYAQARSLVVDRDLDLEHELRNLTPRPENVHTSTDRPWDEPTATGKVACKYQVGAPLLQVPFLALGHLASLGLRAIGVEVADNGYGWPCYLAWRLGIWFFAAVLLLAAARGARRLFGLGKESAMLCAGAALVSGPLLHFATGDPYGAHLHSASLVALLWLLVLEPGALPPRLQSTAPLWLGLCGGLAVCVRATNGVWAVAAALLWLARCERRELPGHCALLGLGGVLGFAPQLAAWLSIYGSIVTDPYEAEGFDFASPALWQNLFGLRAGLFAWNPGWLPALLAVGAVAVAPRLAGARPVGQRERRDLAVLACCAVALLWILSSWWCWWWGDGYGGRAAASLFFAAAIGFAILWRRLAGSRAGIASFVLLVLLSCSWTLDRVQAMERLLPAERATGAGFPDWLR